MRTRTAVSKAVASVPKPSVVPQVKGPPKDPRSQVSEAVAGKVTSFLGLQEGSKKAKTLTEAVQASPKTASTAKSTEV